MQAIELKARIWKRVGLTPNTSYSQTVQNANKTGLIVYVGADAPETNKTKGIILAQRDIETFNTKASEDIWAYCSEDGYCLVDVGSLGSKVEVAAQTVINYELGDDIDLTYDANDNLTAVALTKASDSSVHNVALTYDAKGNLATVR